MGPRAKDPEPAPAMKGQGMGAYGTHEGRTERVIKHLFSRRSTYLPFILKAQLAFLSGLAIVAFVLPLSGPERWTVVLAAGVLAGLTWAILEHVRQR